MNEQSAYSIANITRARTEWPARALKVCGVANEFTMFAYLRMLQPALRPTIKELAELWGVTRHTVRARFRKHGLNWHDYLAPTTLGDFKCGRCLKMFPKNAPAQRFCKPCARIRTRERKRHAKRKPKGEDEPGKAYRMKYPKALVGKSKWNEKHHLVNIGSRNHMAARNF